MTTSYRSPLHNEAHQQQPLLSPLLAVPVPRLLPQPANAVLVVDGCSDAGEALIASLAAVGGWTITAVPYPDTATEEWEARMVEWGVRVDHSVYSTVFAHDARRRLIAAHPRVFLHRQLRFEVRMGNSTYPVSGWHVKDELLDWIRACHYERAQHVVYVSTVSPELFVDAHNCLESCHWEVESKLRQLHVSGKGAIQHYTVLRPVNIMSVFAPPGKVDPLRVIVRCDPAVQRQLIAGSDVGRIAARVLSGTTFYERTIDLSAERQSAMQEAAVRSAVTRRAVQCDAQYWNTSTMCAGWLGEGWWSTPQDGQRAEVSATATRALLPDLLSYADWFKGEWSAAQARGVQPLKMNAHGLCTLQ